MSIQVLALVIVWALMVAGIITAGYGMRKIPVACILAMIGVGLAYPRA